MEHFFTVALICAVVAAVQCCDTYSFERCMTDFTSKYPEATDSFSAKYDEALLEQLCSDFDIADTCATSALRGCSSDIMMIWRVVDDSMDYLCSDNTKIVMRNYSSCFEGQTLQTQIKSCNRTMQNEMSRIKLYGGTVDQLCSAMKAFSSCTVGSVNSNCGDTASSWYGGLIDAALGPSKEAIKCYFTAGSAMVRANLLVLAGALLMHFMMKK